MASQIYDRAQVLLSRKAIVLRDGTLLTVGTTELVPGDILQLEAGSVVPADCFITTEDTLLLVDQSLITGEPAAVSKRRGDTCFYSSIVKQGEAFAIVTATGRNVFVRRAAPLFNLVRDEPGSFTRGLSRITTNLLMAVIVTNFIVWVSSFYRSLPIIKILELSLGIFIAATPIGLRSVFTATMVIGTRDLYTKRVYVRKLSTLESLASLEVLCLSTTGILTRNWVTLAEPYIMGGGKRPGDDLMLAACLTINRRQGRLALDEIDKAFMKSLRYYPRAKIALQRCKVKEFYPFDSASGKATSLAENPYGGQIICVKGSPQAILDTIRKDNGIPKDIEKEYIDKVAEFAGRGFHSIGVARKRERYDWESERPDWEILGIMPYSRPLRPGVQRFVTTTKALGLSIKLISSNSVGTIREICRVLGTETNVYAAELLDRDCTGSEIFDIYEAANGIANASPRQKYSVIEGLQHRGNVVAMLGSTVNTAISINKANVGISIEDASHAASSAADIIMLDSPLEGTLRSVTTARQVIHNVRTYITYQAALSIHLQLYLGLWIVIANRSLKLELVAFLAVFSVIITTASAHDNALCSKTPMKPNVLQIWPRAILLGLFLAAGTWITVTTIYAHDQNGGIIENFGTLDGTVFLQISLTQSWLIFIARSNRAFWEHSPSWKLVVPVVVVDILATVFTLRGWFLGGEQTSIVAVVRIWIFSFGTFLILGGLHYLLQNDAIDNNAVEKLFWKPPKQRSLEDFGTSPHARLGLLSFVVTYTDKHSRLTSARLCSA